MRTPIVVVLAALLLGAPTSGQDATKPDPDVEAQNSILAADVKRHQSYLASDELQGRESGTAGGARAAQYIVEHLQSYGFEPGGPGGSWFQPLKGAVEYGLPAEANLLVVYKDAEMKAFDTFKAREAFMPLKSARGGATWGEVVFAGYGITAPEFTYDDYEGLKVEGAIVLVLDGEPQRKDPASAWNGDKSTKHAFLDAKIANARKHGAAALLVVDPEESGIAKGRDFALPADNAKPKHPISVAWLTASTGEALAKAGSAPGTLAALRDEIDKDLKPRTFRLPGPARLAVSGRGPVQAGEKNILAIWKGKTREEWVVLGAHYDHVGLGSFGTRGGAGQVHNGADDNASGTSTLLDIAQAISMTKPKRSIMLMWFDAEERGLNGSRAWCANPTIPPERIVGMLNLDMIGRNETKDIKVGVEGGVAKPKYPKLVTLMRAAEKEFEIAFDWKYVDDEQLMQRSDHWSFMQKDVPATFFTGGLHADYHTSSDDVERINFDKEQLTGRVAFWMALEMANMKGGLK